MFVITNTTPEGEYSPSTAKTIEEAREWMYECTSENILAYTVGHIMNEEEYSELKKKSNKEICEWAKEKSDLDFEMSEMSTKLYYGDDSYNIMEIHDIG